MAREIITMLEQLSPRPRISPKHHVALEKPKVKQEIVTVQGFNGDPELPGELRMLEDSLIHDIEHTP
jgi:hypothetical protein